MRDQLDDGVIPTAYPAIDRLSEDASRRETKPCGCFTECGRDHETVSTCEQHS